MTHKLQLAVQERADLQRQVNGLQQQLQSAAAEKAAQASTAAAVSRQHSTQQPQQQHTKLGSQPGVSIQDDSMHEGMQSAESGLAGLGLEDQETPGDRSGSRFSLASVQSQGSTAAAAAAAALLGRRGSTGVGSGSYVNGGGGQLYRGSSGLGLASQLSSASNSPMASQARLQQLTGSLSGMLSTEGQLQLQRAVQQLQQELSAVSKERDAAAEQLYQMVRQADAAAAAVHETEKLKQQQAELQHKVKNLLAADCQLRVCKVLASLSSTVLYWSTPCMLTACASLLCANNLTSLQLLSRLMLAGAASTCPGCGTVDSALFLLVCCGFVAA